MIIMDYLNLTIEDGIALAIKNNLNYRIVRIDKKHFIVTQDYKPTRVNFEIDDGKITKVRFG